jgi:hypothetical protein
MASPERCIFGATPVETLQAFRKALVEMVNYVAIGNVLDRLALRFHKTHSRQNFCSTFHQKPYAMG